MLRTTGNPWPHPDVQARSRRGRPGAAPRPDSCPNGASIFRQLTKDERGARLAHVAFAARHWVTVEAHVRYHDLRGFGRRYIAVPKATPANDVR